MCSSGVKLFNFYKLTGSDSVIFYLQHYPNIVITGCNFTNCNVSLCGKFDNNEKATSTVDKASLDELLKGLTPEQLFDD